MSPVRFLFGLLPFLSPLFSLRPKVKFQARNPSNLYTPSWLFGSMFTQKGHTTGGVRSSAFLALSSPSILWLWWSSVIPPLRVGVCNQTSFQRGILIQRRESRASESGYPQEIYLKVSLRMGESRESHLRLITTEVRVTFPLLSSHRHPTGWAPRLVRLRRGLNFSGTLGLNKHMRHESEC